MENPHFLLVFLYCMLYYLTDTYEKIPLSQREKKIGNRKVQRDLYSAFLIRNTDL